jgi:hypothetical protein
VIATPQVSPPRNMQKLALRPEHPAAAELA